MKSDDILLIIILIVAVSAIAYGFYCHSRMKQQIRKLDEMLDKAIDGSFTESCFDESQLSYIENKMWKYLSSSEISARKTAEEKAKIKTLIADISHQTKTPVSNILLYAELLSECNLSDTEKDYAKRIFSQSEKLSFLIKSLVKLSRLETGIIALSTKETAIAPMLRDIVLQAQAKAEERRAMAVALEQEMKAKAQEARAKVIESEAEVPLAMAEAFRNGNLGIMDYYKMKNIIADTQMRESISTPKVEQPKK